MSQVCWTSKDLLHSRNPVVQMASVLQVVVSAERLAPIELEMRTWPQSPLMPDAPESVQVLISVPMEPSPGWNVYVFHAPAVLMFLCPCPLGLWAVQFPLSFSTTCALGTSFRWFRAVGTNDTDGAGDSFQLHQGSLQGLTDLLLEAHLSRLTFLRRRGL